MSASRLPGCFESGGYTERKKDQTKNKVIQNPGEACAEERQTASKARSRVVLASISPVHGSATRLLLSTLTDEFAFRRILRIVVRALPIQIEHHWQVAAGTPPASLCRLPRCNKSARLNIASA